MSNNCVTNETPIDKNIRPVCPECGSDSAMLKTMNCWLCARCGAVVVTYPPIEQTGMESKQDGAHE